MRQLTSIQDITCQDVLKILDCAEHFINGERLNFRGLTCAYSFEGNSLRTRATFLKALNALQIQAIELPNLLKTKETKHHLAGYLDNWLDLFIIRESNHAELKNFAEASRRPVINAMSGYEHPCEVLADLFSVRQHFGTLKDLKFCLVGPTTNVLRSWALLCEKMGLDYIQVIPAEFQSDPSISNHATIQLQEGIRDANVILTDSWPENFNDHNYQITPEALKQAFPEAWLIPCPPFDTQREVSQQAIESNYFAGYDQKSCLYPVQSAIITALLQR